MTSAPASATPTTSTAAPEASLDTFITCSGVGFTTAIAALVLMLSSFMVATGVTDSDPSEGVFGIAFGAVGVGTWIALAGVAAHIAVRRHPRQRVPVASTPAVVSLAWCGLAISLFSFLITDVLGPLSMTWLSSIDYLLLALHAVLLTAGTIPAGLGFLATGIVLRRIRSRRKRAALELEPSR
ncbi:MULTISPECIES: hypothetical protein [unclassified Rathayibacter]|jgi:hypothetical protein|uniref:hypothetical protein n=1 Tax=unclassified Rathayibacter TaxID=2609250 RepID=UPI000CE7FC4E|nr:MULTISPECIES: hypothetical protein [unclassified Rathayibacter]PPF13156.1 hypothetical protein C5B98_01830 [Rathayibacter sp. AY1A5]PPG85688.1 hypothetical protein C5C29_05245 [Rathayibacter sp. AY1H2]PPH19244.1 hypothetical protein C5C35_00555 [Rathayibacter sp. AY1F8]PPH35405.1 hypothetical protein C5C53_12970 [Rathayibacter sp. AY1E3]